jgi:mono/diheme cytochrome c family protein
VSATRAGSVVGSTARLVAAMLALLALAGCERTFRGMYDQARYKPLAHSTLWADGRSARPPVEGTVAHSEGTFAGTSSGRNGASLPAPVLPPLAAVRDELRPPSGEAAAAALDGDDLPRKANGETGRAAFALPPITPALLARGRERFDIFCAPCHSIAGDGDGFVARRGFPHPPSYHIDRLRKASDAHLYAVITDGYGAMYPYARRLTPADRMAVVAYIRALQLSQHAPLSAVPPAERTRLEAQR